MSKQNETNAVVTLPNDNSKASGKALDKSIRSIKTRGVKLDADTHATAIACATHAMTYGDVTRLTMLRNALPKGARVKAFELWAHDHFPVQLKTKKTDANAKITSFSLKSDRTDADWQITKAEKTPFWDYSKEKAPTALDLEHAISRGENLAKAIAKAVKNGDIEQAEVDALVKKLTASVKSIPTLIVDNGTAKAA